MVVLSPRSEPRLEDTEARLTEVTEHIATAFANAEAREAREARARLADEQAALRRVATLVAQDAAPAEIFAAVSAEVDRVFGLDATTLDVAVVGRFEPGPELVVVGVSKGVDVVPLGSSWPPDELFAPTQVLRTRRSARIRADDLVSAGGEVAEFLRHHGYLSQVASPIVADGRLWGAMSVNSRNELPPDTEERLERFTELIDTAIAHAQSRETLAQLADEQAALRRVATLVAQGAAPAEVFAAVSAEVDRVFRLDPVTFDVAGVVRFEPGPELVVVGVSTSVEAVPLGARFPPDELFAPTHVLQTERSARVRADDLEAAGTETAEFLRHHGYLSQVASPIVVDGRLWGAVSVNTRNELPPDTEERLERFTGLVATAIANAESREALAELADEQAALRPVATLVARGAQPNEVFWAVSAEVGRFFRTELAAVGRFEPDRRAVDLVGADRTHERWELADFLVSAEVLRTGRSARADAARWESEEGKTAERLRSLGIVSTVASPIVVEGDLWGAMLVASTDALLPVDTAERLQKFTELVATAIANADSREARAVLTEEQATLRRIATLVAQGVKPEEVFAVVIEEVAATFGVITCVERFEHDPSGVILVGVSEETEVAVGTRWELAHGLASAEVYRTQRSARLDAAGDWSSRGGPVAEEVRRLGIVSQVSCPIIVEGSLWGVITLNAREELPPDTEQRLEKFTGLVTTAIANAESKSELTASRRRIVAAADDARRRIERDLHDGIQQRLLALTFRARAMTREPADELPGSAAELVEGLKEVSDELREVSRGIHPTILTEAGLGPALRALARRSNVPIDVDVTLGERLPAPVEAAAYYVASEALTNVAKHAHANVVELNAARENGVLTLQVRDDGIGGVDAGRGSGILGLTDRVEALSGTISIASPPRGGTTLSIRLPITT
jgi:signal transduction histidine kinase